MINRIHLSANEALLLIMNAMEYSASKNLEMNIAVVDGSGNLLSFARMDGAWIGSIDIAQKKAKTAVMFNMDTAQLGEQAQIGKPLYGINTSNPDIVIFGGGIPITDRDTGEVVGAIGVSGSTVEFDVEVAEFAIVKFWNDLDAEQEEKLEDGPTDTPATPAYGPTFYTEEEVRQRAQQEMDRTGKSAEELLTEPNPNQQVQQ